MSISFSVTPGTAGVVRLQVRARWFQDNILFNYSGNGLAIIDFPFTTTAEGAIDFQSVVENAETGGDAAELVIQRHALPSLRALNFVVEGILGDGVASSVRFDAQAKGLGEYVRSRFVEIPERLL